MNWIAEALIAHIDDSNIPNVSKIKEYNRDIDIALRSNSDNQQILSIAINSDDNCLYSPPLLTFISSLTPQHSSTYFGKNADSISKSNLLFLFLLLKCGANPFTKDDEGKNSFDYLMENPKLSLNTKHEIFKYLLAAYASTPQKPVHTIIKNLKSLIIQVNRLSRQWFGHPLTKQHSAAYYSRQRGLDNYSDWVYLNVPGYKDLKQHQSIWQYQQEQKQTLRNQIQNAISNPTKHFATYLKKLSAHGVPLRTTTIMSSHPPRFTQNPSMVEETAAPATSCEHPSFSPAF